MTTLAEAAAALTRKNDPGAAGYGAAAVKGYSFLEGVELGVNFAFNDAQKTVAMDAMQLWADVAQISFIVDDANPKIAYKNFLDPFQLTFH